MNAEEGWKVCARERCDHTLATHARRRHGDDAPPAAPDDRPISQLLRHFVVGACTFPGCKCIAFVKAAR